ncbi:MAG: hypothetical protein ACKO0Z_08050 [Betaproteobacteria bacterium]
MSQEFYLAFTTPKQGAGTNYVRYDDGRVMVCKDTQDIVLTCVAASARLSG